MSRPARALAALRRRVAHSCPVCGKRFTGIKKAVYCANACRQKAKYKRGKSTRAAWQCSADKRDGTPCKNMAEPYSDGRCRHHKTAKSSGD